MIFPQVLKITEGPTGDPKDTAMAFDGAGVLNDSNQNELGADDLETAIQVDIFLWDLTANSAVATIANKTINFQSDPNIWTLDIDVDIDSSLTDRHKYVGMIKKNAGESIDLREFRLSEFTVDNGSFEQVIARLPYEIVIGAPSEIRWYADTGDFGGGSVLFKAEVYEGGTGTTAATAPERVSHRGPIVEGP